MQTYPLSCNNVSTIGSEYIITSQTKQTKHRTSRPTFRNGRRFRTRSRTFFTTLFLLTGGPIIITKKRKQLCLPFCHRAHRSSRRQRVMAQSKRHADSCVLPAIFQWSVLKLECSTTNHLLLRVSPDAWSESAWFTMRVLCTTGPRVKNVCKAQQAFLGDGWCVRGPSINASSWQKRGSS